MSRVQLSATLAFEALTMGLYGSVVGLVAGYVAVALFVQTASKSFPYGMRFGFWWIALIFAAAIASTLIASAWPCIKVFRLRPMDFKNGGRDPFAPLPIKVIVLGLLMTLPAIALTFPFAISPTLRCTLLGYVGIPLLGIGILLSSPLWIAVIDRIFVGVTARLLRLDPRLLRHQIVRDLGRTIAIMATIAVGLGLYIAIEIWGASMLSPFKPDKALPDIVLTCLPQGMDELILQKVSQVDGIEPGTFMPLIVDQFVLSDEIFTKLESNVQYDL